MKDFPAFTQPFIQAYMVVSSSMPDAVLTLEDAEKKQEAFIYSTNMINVSDMCQPLFERLNKTPFWPLQSSQAVEADRQIVKELQDSMVSNKVGEAWSAVSI